MATQEPTVVIVGDGPTGLSCGLFLAKNGIDCHIVGTDRSPTHKAMLRNYLGLPDTPGPTFIETARRQVEGFGATFHETEVTRIEKKSGRFQVVTEAGETLEADRLVLANGRDSGLAAKLGATIRGDVVQVDRDCRTNIENVYAGGWLVRGAKIQAIISAGDGAVIALDILSKAKGKDFHDFDVHTQPTGRAETTPVAKGR